MEYPFKEFHHSFLVVVYHVDDEELQGEGHQHVDVLAADQKMTDAAVDQDLDPDRG